MELVNIQKDWEKSTYVSTILEAEDTGGQKYIIKRNKVRLTETQYRFFQWLNKTKPEGLLVPLEFTGKIGECSEEVYEFIDWPLLDDVLLGLFPIGSEPAHEWTFSQTLRIMEQLTSALGNLHSQGFIHHDVRARNLFINQKGIEIKLFDYNQLREPYQLSKGQDSWNDVPPEYRNGNCTIDFRFDVYQAGRLFFNMTDGYTRDSPKRRLNIDVLDRALEIIDRASHEQVGERYHDCNEFNKAICSLRK